MSLTTELNRNNDKLLNAPPEDSVSELAFSPSAMLLSVAAWDNKVRVYEIGGGGESVGAAMWQHDAPVLSTDWSSDGRLIASGGCDKAVKCYDPQTQTAVQIGQHDAPVQSVRFVQAPGSSSPIVASSSWDKTLKYWDARTPRAPIASVALPDQAYCMDAQNNLLVVATAERHVCVFDLNNPTTIFKSTVSPLKWQTKSIACFPSADGYALGSIEGRCAIQYVDAAQQTENGFTYKCHRQAQKETETPARADCFVYAINAIAFHSQFGTYVTCGSDGRINIWDKVSRYRLKGSGDIGGSVVSASFTNTGSILAYAVSYDWSKGFQFSQTLGSRIYLHPVQEEEVKPKPKKK